MLGLLLMWSVKAQANAESKISQASLLIQKLGEQGIVLSESESASLMLTIIIMAIAVLLSVAVLLTGVFGIRAANDPEKVTPYLVTSGILLAYRIFDILATILNQTFTLTFWTLIGVGYFCACGLAWRVHQAAAGSGAHAWGAAVTCRDSL